MRNVEQVRINAWISISLGYGFVANTMICVNSQVKPHILRLCVSRGNTLSTISEAGEQGGKGNSRAGSIQ